jgi:hypothetical protein
MTLANWQPVPRPVLGPRTTFHPLAPLSSSSTMPRISEWLTVLLQSLGDYSPRGFIFTKLQCAPKIGKNGTVEEG